MIDATVAAEVWAILATGAIIPAFVSVARAFSKLRELELKDEEQARFIIALKSEADAKVTAMKTEIDSRLASIYTRLDKGDDHFGRVMESLAELRTKMDILLSPDFRHRDSQK